MEKKKKQSRKVRTGSGKPQAGVGLDEGWRHGSPEGHVHQGMGLRDDWSGPQG